MTRFEINESLGGTDKYRTRVEAAKYKLEGDYFVFYADNSYTRKVLTVRASLVSTIDTVPEGKK
ncbi:MAG: hypothetical protein Q4P23_10210 [Micrococcaceae bacterium]|nr:hypothetical protein [Micrococcaceae bacterium]